MNVITAIFAAALDLIDTLLDFYVWVLIVGAIISWLAVFDVVNTRNRLIQIVNDFCFRLTEPVLARVRRFIPLVGGLDLSPLVVIFAIMFIRSFISHLSIG